MRTIANTLPASTRSAAFAALLALCLLFAQALGFAHAYAHADRADESATAQVAKDKLFHHAKAGCAAFDAATLGAGLHTPDYALPAAVAAAGDITVPPTESRTPPFGAAFDSRAPPTQA